MLYSLYWHSTTQGSLYLLDPQIKDRLSVLQETVLQQKICCPQGHEAANVNDLHQVRLAVFTQARKCLGAPQSGAEPGAAPGREQTADHLFSSLTPAACSSGSKGVRSCGSLAYV